MLAWYLATVVIIKTSISKACFHDTKFQLKIFPIVRKTCDMPIIVERMLVFAPKDMCSYFRSSALSQRRRKMGTTTTKHILRYAALDIVYDCYSFK